VISVTLTCGLGGSDSESGERDEGEVLEGFVFGFYVMLGLGDGEELGVLVQRLEKREQNNASGKLGTPIDRTD
jgi:hypothetical protein